MINNRQNGRRRGRGGQQVRNGQPGAPDRGNRLDSRARGNAAQLLEKYKTLARDAQMQGDRVNTEYYLQFADHYFRVLAETRSRFEEQRPRQREDYRGDDFDGDGDNEARGYDGRDDGDGWDDGDAPQQPQHQPQAQARPRREERREEGERSAQERGPERGNGEGRSEGRGENRGDVRPRRNAPRSGNGNGDRYEGAAEQSAPERIELDRLPPAFSAPAAAPTSEGTEGDGEAERPRRRPRRPRETVVADA